jgi:hypothetical protein
MGFQPNAFYTIMNRHSNLQLAVSYGSAQDGAQLIQWPPDGTDAQIFLAVQPTPDTNPVYQFLPLTTLLTLGISNGSLDPGAAVVQWPPDSGPNQRFLLTPAVENGYVTITSEASRLVLGIAGGSTSKGTAVIQWTPVNSPDQMFMLEDAGAGYVHIRNRNSGLLLAISGGSVKRGAALIQWPADGSDAQSFLLAGDEESGYMILPKSSIKVLGIAGGSTSPGADVVQWHPDGSANQQFALAGLDTGFVQIISPETGLVLGIADGSVKPAARVVQWQDTGAADQRFGLTPISRAKQPLTAADLAPGTALYQAMLDYCPELRLHPMERYFPDDIGHFITSSQVRDSHNKVVLDEPDAVDLVQYGAWGSQPGHGDKEAYYLSPPRNWNDPIIHGLIPVGRAAIGSGLYKGGYHGGKIGVPMAARGFSVNGTYWFDYVFFYPYNGPQVLRVEPTSVNPLFDTGDMVLSPQATHIGDWEHAQVQVSGDLKTIMAIRVFNHGDPTLIRHTPDDPAWGRLRFTEGSHVVLYSGLHSHATYSTPGFHLQEIYWIMPYLAPLLGIKDVNTCDWCDDGGAVWRGWENLVTFGVDGSGRALPGFPGMEWPEFYPHRWGKSRYLDDAAIEQVGPNVPWTTSEVREAILYAVEIGIKLSISELIDGLGVSPPDWWRSGF